MRAAVVFLLSLACVAEYAGGRGAFAVQPMPSLDSPPPVYAWLATQPTSVIAELPLTSEMAHSPPANLEAGLAGAWPDDNSLRYQYFGMAHWQPSVDGYSGFVPPHHRELALTLAGFPSPRALALLRGLDVEWVIVHSALMEAFRPGKAISLREALAETPGVAHERDFGPDWVYRVSPAPAPGVAGRFWSTDRGHAFLMLAAQSPDTAVLRPGQPLHIRAKWRAENTGVEPTADRSVSLPLLVGESGIVPLGLAWPARPGTYTLSLSVEDAPWAIAPYERTVTISAETNPVHLLAIRPASVPAHLRGVPGGELVLDLGWRLLDRPRDDYSVSARVVDPGGAIIAQEDRPLSGGRDLVQGWQPGQVLTTTHHLRLPADGRESYTLQAFLYRPGDPAGYWFLDEGGEPLNALNRPLGIKSAGLTTTALPPPAFLAEFGEQVYLLTAVPRLPSEPGQPFTLAAGWTTAGLLDTSYTFFVHLVSSSGELLAQHDGPPQGGRYLTSIWDVGEVVTDTVEVDLPPAARGQTLCLRVGLYDPATLARLPRTDAAGDFWQEQECRIFPE